MIEYVALMNSVENVLVVLKKMSASCVTCLSMMGSQLSFKCSQIKYFSFCELYFAHSLSTISSVATRKIFNLEKTFFWIACNCKVSFTRFVGVCLFFLV